MGTSKKSCEIEASVREETNGLPGGDKAAESFACVQSDGTHAWFWLQWGHHRVSVWVFIEAVAPQGHKKLKQPIVSSFRSKHLVFSHSDLLTPIVFEFLRSPGYQLT